VGTMVILPLGITKEYVTGILRQNNLGRIEAIVSVTTPGFEETKSDIINALKTTSELLGARYQHIVIGLGDAGASAKIYRIIKNIKPSRIVVSLITGSRYLIPILAQAILRYWKETGVETYMIHGIEGEKWELQPFIGFFTFHLTREQLRLFKIIYEHPNDYMRTKEDLIEKYRYTKTVYKVLDRLDKKGLIRHKRNRIEKTFPGRLLYNLLREAGVI